MSAVALAKADKFFAPEITKIVYCLTVANPDAPTRSEINAGTEMAGGISEINGWTVTSAQLDCEDYGSRFTSKIGGRIEVADSSFKFYQSSDTNDIRQILPRGTTGYVLILWGGDVPTQTMDVFHIEVISAGKSLPDSAAADITVSFSIVEEPVEDAVIPA